MTVNGWRPIRMAMGKSMPGAAEPVSSGIPTVELGRFDQVGIGRFIVDLVKGFLHRRVLRSEPRIPIRWTLASWTGGAEGWDNRVGDGIHCPKR